jgi:hypothetical protein
VKSYGNNKSGFSFLQTTYGSTSVHGPYARFISGTMWEWFTKYGVLKENYIQAMEHETTTKEKSQIEHAQIF